MKKTITLSVASVVVLASMSFDILNSTGKAGDTGSPGEKTCTDCHSTYKVNSGKGSVKIECATLSNWKYEFDKTYTINVTVANTGVSLFGLGFEALTAAGANAGILTAGSSTKTQTATVKGNSRTNIVHTGRGNAVANSCVFTFTWQSPATDEGDVTFYCAGNAANKNQSTSGDYIYTTSQVLTPATSTVITEQEIFAKQISIFPNPATNHLQLVNSFNAAEKMTISILDQKGALIRQPQKVNSSERIAIDDLNNGMYTIKIEAAGKVIAKRFIKQ